MDIISLFHSFQTQEQCINYLEKVRWQGEPCCVYCGSTKVCRHASGDRAMPRWQCQDCGRSFAVTVGTIFHRTHVPLQQWFLVLALMLNAKKSASACQIARDLGMRRPTVWSMMHRVRVAMAENENESRLLYGIVEADETYVGGKPRKRNRHANAPKAKRGRGTEKTVVLGAIERGGRVAARPAADARGKTLHKFLKESVEKDGTLLITDQFAAYDKAAADRTRAVINHSIEYANGPTHTNTIEGFWSLLKRAWYGQHHHYSRAYLPLYVSEACYKYNDRSNGDGFGTLVRRMLRV